MDESHVESIVGLHHIGLTVKDLEQSLVFYENMLGTVRDFVVESAGEELSIAIGVPDARLKFAFLSLGSVHLELLEYHNERCQEYKLRNSDVGAAHVCFEVRNLPEAMRKLVASGIKFYSSPFRIEDGPLAGYSFVYFDDPDGITLELFEHPQSRSV